MSDPDRALEHRQVERVAIAIKRGSREASRLGADLAEWIKRRGLEVQLDDSITLEDVEPLDLDDFEPLCGGRQLMIVLGGDGTLLSVARRMPPEVPVLGVNLGSLGFLTEVSRGELYPALVDVLTGRYRTVERSLLQVELRRTSGSVSRFRVLNDAVVSSKSALARLIHLTVKIDGRLIAIYRADGLMVATPTGSTAYNLSAGGPIVHPSLRVAVITPICPHTLSMRPVVIPHTSTIEISLDSPEEEVHLTLDGQEGATLGYRDTISVQAAAEPIRLVQVGGRTFYDALRDKLRWGS